MQKNQELSKGAEVLHIIGAEPGWLDALVRDNIGSKGFILDECNEMLEQLGSLFDEILSLSSTDSLSSELATLLWREWC